MSSAEKAAPPRPARLLPPLPPSCPLEDAADDAEGWPSASLVPGLPWSVTALVGTTGFLLKVGIGLRDITGFLEKVIGAFTGNNRFGTSSDMASGAKPLARAASEDADGAADASNCPPTKPTGKALRASLQSLGGCSVPWDARSASCAVAVVMAAGAVWSASVAAAGTDAADCLRSIEALGPPEAAAMASMAASASSVVRERHESALSICCLRRSGLLRSHALSRGSRTSGRCLGPFSR
mmetsp:Transcript_66792/g.168643  ORF Transcript_66792/g.168643 Transcript_66792/m.168643 type:complete len:239 (-) Transcript_66792:613-1329(-)